MVNLIRDFSDYLKTIVDTDEGDVGLYCDLMQK